ncbi:uncharacterized protein V6R79_003385 [Siganus canaliculatus]
MRKVKQVVVPHIVRRQITSNRGSGMWRQLLSVIRASDVVVIFCKNQSTFCLTSFVPEAGLLPAEEVASVTHSNLTHDLRTRRTCSADWMQWESPDVKATEVQQQLEMTAHSSWPPYPFH